MTPTITINSSTPNSLRSSLENNWKIVEDKQLGQFGSKKSAIGRDLNREYGFMSWRIAWQVENGEAIPFEKALDYYEKAYLEHFTRNPDIASYVADNFSNVYDTNEANISSGTDYSKQEGKSTHLQDIAIRRVLETLGLEFKGEKLLQIRSRSRDKVGKTLSPGKVPFNHPELIKKDGNKPRWCLEDSIEHFWQSNKVLQINTFLQELTPKVRNLNFQRIVSVVGDIFLRD